MYYVYLLKSGAADVKYIGCTADLRKRMLEHNRGKVTSTKGKLPWKLVYYEAFLSKYDAFNREKELKKEYTKKRHLMSRLKDSLQQ